MLKRRRREPATLRLYYASDVHGSDVCWRKFLNAARFYEVGTLIMTVVSLLLMSVAVIVFAGRRSQLWRAPVANGRIGGVAITTIAGWGAIVVAILNGYFYLHYSGLGLTNRGEAYRNVGIAVALALVIYFVAATIRARARNSFGSSDVRDSARVNRPGANNRR